MTFAFFYFSIPGALFKNSSAFPTSHATRQLGRKDRDSFCTRRQKFSKVGMHSSEMRRNNQRLFTVVSNFPIAFSRIVSRNNKTPPHARLVGTSVVCWDDDGRFSLLPIRFLLFCLLWGSLFSHRLGRTYTTFEFFSPLSHDCVTAGLLLMANAFLSQPLVLSQVSPDERTSFGSAFGKIGKFWHCALWAESRVDNSNHDLNFGKTGSKSW